MKFKSQVYTQVSGSIGGITYAHAKGGAMYARARSVPADPTTPFQVQMRNILAFLVNTWLGGLSTAQRSTWDDYSANVPVVNTLGDSGLISGQNWFIGANAIRAQAAAKLTSTLNIIVAAPVIYNRGEFNLPIGVAYDDTTGLSLAYVDTDDWTSEDGAAMLVYQGLPRNPSRLSYSGPWRLVGAIEGDSVTPPTSPFTVTAANLASRGFTVAIGQFISTAVVVVRSDGRYSTRFILPSVTAT